MIPGNNINYLALLLLLLTIKLAADVRVKIDVYPKSVKAGDDLTVKCLIYNTTSNVRLKTSFKCPFIGETREYCLLDCVSLCQRFPCTDKEKFINSIKCSGDANNDPQVFSYNIPSITKEQIDNRKLLPFSCKYRGMEALENVIVTESIDTNTNDGVGSSLVVTDRPAKTNRKSSTQNSIIVTKDIWDFDLRNIVLIVLISSLITSFLINVWCCVQWCMRRAKMKKRKRLTKSQMNSQIIQDSNHVTGYHIANDNNQPLNDDSQYDARYYNDDNIRRARSQPLLNHGGKATPIKVSTSNLNNVRAGSVNNNLKYRTSIYNTSLNDFYHNGSINEQMVPVAPSPQFIGYMNPQYIPMQNIMYNPYLIDRMNMSQSEDLNTLTEQSSPERRNSSIVQPLPLKPDDCSSNLESASSSHIV